MYNLRRLSKLILRGKIDKIFFAEDTERENNFQKLVRYKNNRLNAILKQTMNTTLNELATAAKNSTKQFLKNLICFVPNVFRRLQTKQPHGNRRSAKQYIRTLLKTPGERFL